MSSTRYCAQPPSQPLRQQIYQHLLLAPALKVQPFNVQALNVQALKPQTLQPQLAHPAKPSYNDKGHDEYSAEALDSLQLATSWWLLGTQGCHLCTLAANTLRLFCQVYPIPVVSIDIADFDAALMLQFATQIPVLLTPTQCLSGPFSLLDLEKLL